ncbi:SDR family oxidoreductase [Dactylosporangium sp. CA-233914]|uniref:SDR family oxidoreductase n=1 Tax=Dactylosporangium sp. CA-233914 TaxID=3239934 RepID=UPI003D8B7E9F
MVTRGTAVVTGASRGIGRDCALRLAELGYDVAVGYHSRLDAAEEVVRQIELYGRSAVAIPVETADPESCAAFVAGGRELGPVRAIVSNATGFGIAAPQLGTAIATPPATYETMVSARVGALLALVAAAGSDLTDGGRIVAITSTGTSRVIPGYAAIAAAMAATETVVRYLAVELGRTGVTANVVSGGLVRTDALSEISADPERMVAAVTRGTPSRRIAEPNDLAGVVGFLCSPEGGWVNGQTVVVDGGYSRC